MAKETWRPASIDEARALIAELKTAPIGQNSVHFALSLTGQYDRKGDLSEFQWPYVRKMLTECKKPVQDKEQIDFDGTLVRNLFIKATEHMKFPNMNLGSSNGDPVNIRAYLSINSKDMKGWVIFKDMRTQTYIAHINTAGEGYYRTACTNEQADIISAYAKDPIAYAKMQGIKYKRCCFCGTEITNISSRYHGYGPICAENYGLPWGDVPAEAAAQLQAEIDSELEKDL
jgi:hypothetical protein